MAKSLRLGSKLMAALILLNSISADCLSEITHSGIVCDINDSYTSYADKTAFCNTAGTDVNNLLEYCKIAPCEGCDARLVGCKSMINQIDDQYLAKNYNSQNGDPQVAQYQGKCKITVGEECYRRSLDEDTYTGIFEDLDDTVDASDNECCLYECFDINSVVTGGCGSDGTFYTDITAFCQNYCTDRSMTLTSCGQPGCGLAQGCPDPCLTETIEPPFCSDTFVYYNDKTAYCADKGNSLVSSTIACNPNCSQPGCDYLKCLDSTSAYLLGSVCLETKLNGINFYETIASYCTAKVNANDTNYPITNYNDCNTTSCLTSVDCCNSLCMEETYFVGCDKTTFTLVDQTAYCAFRCSNNGINKVMDTCTNSGSTASCADCNFFQCINAIATVAGYTNVCGKGSGAEDVYYGNVNDFCNANLTDYSTSFILCAGNVECGSDANF